MTAPLPHELLADPRAAEDDLAAPHRTHPAGSNGTNGRRVRPLAQGLEAMADGIAGAVDRLRARPLLIGRRGRSNARSNLRGNNRGSRFGSRGRSSSGGRPSQRRSSSPDRSRSRSVDSWGRSLSPARNAEGQEERKHKLFSNYARYAAARASANERGGRRRKWRGLQVFAVSPDEDVEAGRRGCDDRPSSKNRSSSKVGKNGTSGQPKFHPFVLPPTLRLAPRTDAWLGFAVASCAAVASIGQLHANTARSDEWQFSSRDTFALAVCAMSFVVSFCVAGGMRHSPARNFLTATRFTLGPRPLSQLNLTHELFLLSLLLIFWTAALPIVVNGNAYYSESGAGVPLGIAGSSVWNANLFCSAWACYLLNVYLCVELVTLDDRRGTVKIAARSSHSSSGRQGKRDPPSLRPANAFAKRWTLLSVAALILMSASIGTYTGPACSGRLLKETTYCARALWGVVVGGLLQVLVGLGVAALYRLSAVPSRSYPRSRSRVQPALSVAKRNQICALSSLASLILQSVTAGMLTSPAGGGPGTSSGTLYFASWLGFGLAFELGLRYLELCSADFGAGAGGPRGGSRGLRSELVEKETVYEDESEGEDESEEEALVLRNGSEAGSQRSSRSPVRDEGGTDARSFVFQQRGERVQAPPSRHYRQDDPPVAPVPRPGALEPEALRPSHHTGSGGTGSSGTDPSAGSIDAKSVLKSSDDFEDAPRATYAGFHLNQVETLDDPIRRRDPSGYAMEEPRYERKLSSLQEGRGESSSPKPGSGAPRRRVGDNLKHVRAARRPGPRKLAGPGSRAASKQSGRSGKRSKASAGLRASGSNPPPTVSDKSDGTSSSAPSTVDLPSTQSGSGQPVMGTIRPRSVVGPPPHGRSEPRDDQQSQYSASAPLRSIRGGSSDSIVSDPTLDAGLDDPPPKAKAKPRARSSSSGRAQRGSSRHASRSRSRGKSAGAYRKQARDETPETQRIPSSGSDENPSSQEAGAGDDRVDTIVAAALAYAERTHGATGDRAAGRRRGGTGGGSLDSAGTREGGTHFDC